MLRLPGSIWDFENQCIPSITHYAVTTAALKYMHIVEKGRWLTDAHKLFSSANLPFEPGHRPILSVMRQFRLKLDRVKFMAIGYSYVRLKRLLSVHSKAKCDSV